MLPFVSVMILGACALPDRVASSKTDWGVSSIFQFFHSEMVRDDVLDCRKLAQHHARVRRPHVPVDCCHERLNHRCNNPLQALFFQPMGLVCAWPGVRSFDGGSLSKQAVFVTQTQLSCHIKLAGSCTKVTCLRRTTRLRCARKSEKRP